MKVENGLKILLKSILEDKLTRLETRNKSEMADLAEISIEYKAMNDLLQECTILCVDIDEYKNLGHKTETKELATIDETVPRKRSRNSDLSSNSITHNSITGSIGANTEKVVNSNNKAATNIKDYMKNANNLIKSANKGEKKGDTIHTSNKKSAVNEEQDNKLESNKSYTFNRNKTPKRVLTDRGNKSGVNTSGNINFTNFNSNNNLNISQTIIQNKETKETQQNSHNPQNSQNQAYFSNNTNTPQSNISNSINKEDHKGGLTKNQTVSNFKVNNSNTLFTPTVSSSSKIREAKKLEQTINHTRSEKSLVREKSLGKEKYEQTLENKPEKLDKAISHREFDRKNEKSTPRVRPEIKQIEKIPREKLDERKNDKSSTRERNDVNHERRKSEKSLQRDKSKTTVLKNYKSKKDINPIKKQSTNGPTNKEVKKILGKNGIINDITQSINSTNITPSKTEEKIFIEPSENNNSISKKINIDEEIRNTSINDTDKITPLIKEEIKITPVKLKDLIEEKKTIADYINEFYKLHSFDYILKYLNKKDLLDNLLINKKIGKICINILISNQKTKENKEREEANQKLKSLKDVK